MCSSIVFLPRLLLFFVYYLQRLRCAHAYTTLVLFVNAHFVTYRTSLEATQTHVRRPTITPMRLVKAGARRIFRLEISLRDTWKEIQLDVGYYVDLLKVEYDKI